MNLFLIAASLIFLLFGSLLLLSPDVVIKLLEISNRVLFSVDERIRNYRRPLGILFLAITIYLWYVAFTY